jgi:phosphoenolpyruvate-protein kinase (PTS system EI component)
VAWADLGDPVILVRTHPATEDIDALAVCRGLLTATGARTSHAAVVARHLGVVCVWTAEPSPLTRPPNAAQVGNVTCGRATLSPWTAAPAPSMPGPSS